MWATGGPARTPATVGDFSEVLAAAKSGADWAMTVLFRRFNPRLVRYLRAADSNSYEDVVAEVWLSVAFGLAGFEGVETEFRAWLFTIARNRLIDHGRRAARRPATPLAEEHLAGKRAADPAEEVTERLSVEAAVDRLVSGLSPPQSQVVLLRVVGGFEVAEVAHIMGRSPGWVRVTQHRALLRLATLNHNRRREGA